MLARRNFIWVLKEVHLFILTMLVIQPLISFQCHPLVITDQVCHPLVLIEEAYHPLVLIEEACHPLVLIEEARLHKTAFIPVHIRNFLHNDSLLKLF